MFDRRPTSDETFSFEVTSADEHGFEGSESKVVVRLGGELLGAKVEEGNDLGGEGLGASESLREEHDLGDEFEIGFGHGHALRRVEVLAVQYVNGGKKKTREGTNPEEL